MQLLDLTQPGCSSPIDNSVFSVPAPTQFKEILSQLSPHPRAAEKRLSVRKRRSGKSEILTSTTVKDELEEKARKKVQVVTQKRKIKFNTSSNEEKKGKQKQIKKPGVEEQKNETRCNICGETFDEKWIQCCFCHEWSHEACANVTHPLYYKCDNCL